MEAEVIEERKHYRFDKTKDRGRGGTVNTEDSAPWASPPSLCLSMVAAICTSSSPPDLVGS